MRRRQFLAASAALAAPLSAWSPASAAAAVRLPTRADVVTVLRLVADHWIGANSDPGDNQWARATFFSGLMALHRLTGEPRYLNYARGWAEKHSYGLNGGVTTRHADNHCAGQTYLDLYAIEPEQAKIAAIEQSLRGMIAAPDGYDDWTWCDALHMAMPPFARLGVLRGEAAFADTMHGLYTHTKSAEGGPGLYDTGSGLWYRDARFLPGGITSPSGLPVLWSRGNGWVAAAHVKVLGALPATHRDAPEYRRTLAAGLTALRKVQRTDGFWNVNLADPAHLPGPETSGTAFFTYATAYGIRTGLVTAAQYQSVVAGAWNGLVTKAVHSDGFLGYVQNVGDRPESSQPVTYNSTADFGVGAFLLAGVEVAALAGA